MKKLTDWNDKLDFGKYRKLTVREVFEKDPAYLKWVMESTERAAFPEKIEHAIMMRATDDYLASQSWENYFDDHPINNTFKPEILTHPNIPKPLHGLSPREIKGKEWWDEARQLAYQKYNYHCAACGTHKSHAKGPKWLEAHEYYEYNYKLGIAKILSIEPLCHYCHNFIHSGRLSVIMDRKDGKSREEVEDILSHGIEVLAMNGLEMFYSTYQFAALLGLNLMGVDCAKAPRSSVKFGDWKLIFENITYPAKFKSLEEWKEYYGHT